MGGRGREAALDRQRGEVLETWMADTASVSGRAFTVLEVGSVELGESIWIAYGMSGAYIRKNSFGVYWGSREDTMADRQRHKNR